MKTEIIPTWTEADTRRINAIEEKLHLALRLSQRLEKKISVEYLDSEKQDFKTDAIICMNIPIYFINELNLCWLLVLIFLSFCPL